MSSNGPLPLLVVGAGISGVTTALEAAEAGRDVILVEKDATIGGRVVGLHHYFPKLCPPTCGMEINTRRLEHNSRVTVHTSTRVTAASRAGGTWSVTLSHAPRHVSEACTACGACSEACPARVPDPFNLGMQQVPAIRAARPGGWPHAFVLDREACPEGCRACVDACPVNAVDLAASGCEETVEAGAVVVATGWRPYPLEKLAELGGGVLADVVSNVQMERLASSTGPTAGKILRPSDGEAPRRVAFVQCAGSRDVNHLPYCSGVCCLASLKQALYVKEQLPETEVAVYYIDRRTPGRNEDMLTRVAATAGVRLVKGKVGRVTADGGELVLRLEDVEAGVLQDARADLVVLATGMVPNLGEDPLPLDLLLDEDGFGLENLATGVAVAGVAHRPGDVASSVRDATGAAAKAIVAAGRRA